MKVYKTAQKAVFSIDKTDFLCYTQRLHETRFLQHKAVKRCLTKSEVVKMSLKMLVAVVAVLAQIVIAPAAYACNDSKHGHPVGQKCDRDQVSQTQSQTQQQGQNQAQTTTVTSNPTATAASNSTSQSNSSATTGPQTTNVTTGPSTATGGSATASGGTSSASNGDQSTTVQTGDVKTGDSNSNATSNSEGGTSSIEGSGNGGGATVNQETTNVNKSKVLVFTPVQPAALPPTIAVGGINLVAMGSCGQRVKVKPFEREAHVPQVFGLWQKSIAVATMHGTLAGFDDEQPFLVKTALIPAPYNQQVVTVYGHQVYLTVGWDGQGGSSSGAANYASEKAIGVGLGLSANAAFGVVGVVAVDCVYDVKSALKVSEIEIQKVPVEQKTEVAAPVLDLEKIKVRSDAGKYIRRKKADPKQLCGAGPDEECVWSSDRVEVVKDAKLNSAK